MLPNRPGLRSTRLADGVVLTIQMGLTDEQAAGLYLLLKKDGLLSYYFHESMPSLTGFLQMVASPSNIFYGCFLGREDSESVDIVGLVSGSNYVRSAAGGKADACMIFLKSVHRHDSSLALEFVEMVLDDAFENEHLNLIALYAAIPAPNLASIRFMRRIGFEQYGIAPKFCTWEGVAVDAVMAALTKERWYARNTKAATSTTALNGAGPHG